MNPGPGLPGEGTPCRLVRATSRPAADASDRPSRRIPRRSPRRRRTGLPAALRPVRLLVRSDRISPDPLREDDLRRLVVGRCPLDVHRRVVGRHFGYRFDGLADGRTAAEPRSQPSTEAAVIAPELFCTVKYRLPIPSMLPRLSVTVHEIVWVPFAERRGVQREVADCAVRSWRSRGTPSRYPNGSCCRPGVPWPRRRCRPSSSTRWSESCLAATTPTRTRCRPNLISCRPAPAYQSCRRAFSAPVLLADMVLAPR